MLIRGYIKIPWTFQFPNSNFVCPGGKCWHVSKNTFSLHFQQTCRSYRMRKRLLFVLWLSPLIVPISDRRLQKCFLCWYGLGGHLELVSWHFYRYLKHQALWSKIKQDNINYAGPLSKKKCKVIYLTGWKTRGRIYIMVTSITLLSHDNYNNSNIKKDDDNNKPRTRKS